MRVGIGRLKDRVLEEDAACILFLCCAVAVSLLPFLGKAFHIDDTLFLMAARQIREHPFDCYGFDVNWYGATMRMADVTKNPPLTCYYLAAVAGLVGWSEPPLHAAFVLPAAAAIVGTWRLAGEWTRGRSAAVVAALATLVSPVFLISSTSIMCDTMMLALFVWSIVFWERGLRNDDPLCLIWAGLLVAACGLTKYFGVALVPLLFVHAMVRRRRAGWWIVALLIPIAAFVGYQLLTKQLYGRGLLMDAAEYASGARTRRGDPPTLKLLTGLIFTGGCCLPVLACLPRLWSPRAIAGWAALSAAVGLGFNAAFPEPGGWSWARLAVAVQGGVFAAAGAVVLTMAVLDCHRRRDPASLLLLLWVAGTFTFAALVNWTINGRSLLPMAPAAAILLARRLEDRGHDPTAATPCLPLALPPAISLVMSLAVPLVISLVISLAMAHADQSHADSARQAAAMIRDRAASRAGGTWFQGHWGFQHYMEAWGARPVDFTKPGFRPGDLLAIPANNSNCRTIDGRQFAVVEEWSLPLCGWASVFHADARTGFYASSYGPLPFAFGPTTPEIYGLLEFHGGKKAGPPAAPASRETSDDQR